jgi:hypothetical protein
VKFCEYLSDQELLKNCSLWSKLSLGYYFIRVYVQTYIHFSFTIYSGLTNIHLHTSLHTPAAYVLCMAQYSSKPNVHAAVVTNILGRYVCFRFWTRSVSFNCD